MVVVRSAHEAAIGQHSPSLWGFLEARSPQLHKPLLRNSSKEKVRVLECKASWCRLRNSAHCTVVNLVFGFTNANSCIIKTRLVGVRGPRKNGVASRRADHEVLAIRQGTHLEKPGSSALSGYVFSRGTPRELRAGKALACFSPLARPLVNVRRYLRHAPPPNQRKCLYRVPIAR